MAWRLPPLKALRAFAAAGKHLSFTLAAEELYVTAGAVSRQIKLLEDYLGVQLFVRANRDVILAPESKAYYMAVCELFSRLEAGTNRLVGATQDRPLRIVCPMTLTMRWLVPKLLAYHDAYPDQQVCITTTLSLLRNLPTSSEVDIAFQLDHGEIPGWISHPVLESRLTPVCRPKLIAPKTRLESPEELARYTILHSTARRDAWDLWTAKVKGVDLSKARTIEFASSALAFQAATQGLGIAMGDLGLVQGDLDSRALIRPINKTVNTGLHYCMVYAAEAAKDKRIKQFSEWLLNDVQPPGRVAAK